MRCPPRFPFAVSLSVFVSVAVWSICCDCVYGGRCLYTKPGALRDGFSSEPIPFRIAPAKRPATVSAPILIAKSARVAPASQQQQQQPTATVVSVCSVWRCCVVVAVVVVIFPLYTLQLIERVITFSGISQQTSARVRTENERSYEHTFAARKARMHTARRNIDASMFRSVRVLRGTCTCASFPLLHIWGRDAAVSGSGFAAFCQIAHSSVGRAHPLVTLLCVHVAWMGKQHQQIVYIIFRCSYIILSPETCSDEHTTHSLYLFMCICGNVL